MRINTAAEDNIACAAVSPCGAWVACAHASRLSLYALREDQDGTLDIDKVLRPKTRRTPPARAQRTKTLPAARSPTHKEQRTRPRPLAAPPAAPRPRGDTSAPRCGADPPPLVLSGHAASVTPY